MRQLLLRVVFCVCLASVGQTSGGQVNVGQLAHSATYDVEYVADIRPAGALIRMELKLSGERLPSKLVLHIDPKRQRTFTSADDLEIGADTVTWRPKGKSARLSYEVLVNHERARNSYDSYLGPDWAVFRGERLVPRTAVTARRSLQARTTLRFERPGGWSVITPYAPGKNGVLKIDDPQRKFDRPEGWILAGKLGNRVETIAGIRTVIAAPTGDNARRQDLLSFLNWNLPQLAAIFNTLPKRLLVVTAGEPMWRGGLSGPSSLFIHADLPLISENRTSTLLHELVHVAMGIRGDRESDWIVEGFAEFYSLEILRRSGGISQKRHEDAIRRLTEWAQRAPTVFAKESSGAHTARAVVTLRALDTEIRTATAERASLDDVARELASKRSEIGLAELQAIVQRISGQPARTLERERLSAGPQSLDSAPGH